MAAFSDLCDLISQADGFLKSGGRKENIQKALGEDGHLLAYSISNISQFLDHSNSNGVPKAETAFTMFKVACKTFLRAMSSEDHPIVLVLDDIQWMDYGSEQLITMLLEDKEIKNVLLILVYRDEEAENATGMFYGETKQLIDIQLKNLDAPAVHQMMICMLNTAPSEQTLALGDLVVQRTSGNPFHVWQFGEFLEHEGLLEYSAENSNWNYDVEKIRKETMLSDTLADVLTKKIQRLNINVRKTLMVASLFGFHFSGATVTSTLESIKQKDAEDLYGITVFFKNEDDAALVSTLLDDAVSTGFIERTSDGFQFGHDKLQSSFHSMLKQHEILQLHKVIGEVFLQQRDDESTYHAAVHLNRAAELFETDEQRIHLAQTFLQASAYCKQRSAFFNGAEFLRAALHMIPEAERWTDHYTLTREIVGSLAKIELVVGNFAACKEMNEDLLLHMESIDEKLDSLITSTEVVIAEHSQPTECSKAVNKALAVLGIKQPARLTLPHILAKLVKVKYLLLGRTDEDIMSMRAMSNKANITAVQLLVYGGFFGLVNDQEKHAVYYALLAVELSLTFGLSKFSPNAFAIYSMAELVMGNLGRAYRFGNLAKAMVDHLQCQQTGSGSIVLVNNVVTHWKESLHQIAEPTNRAMGICIEAGELDFGIFGAAVLAGFRTCMGDNLGQLEEDFHELYSRFKNFKHFASIRCFEPNFQFVLNLRHHDENWRALADVSGHIMQEGDFIQNAIETNRRILLPVMWISKLQLAYHYGLDQLAETVLVDLDSFKQILRYGFNFVTWRLYGALTYYERYRLTSKRKYLRKARKFKQSFHMKTMTQCPNASPLLALLNAEEVAIKGTLDEVSEAYDSAAAVLSTARLVHMEALANERAAYALSTDRQDTDRNKAEQYFLRAMKLYKYGWGATAKYDWLEQRKDRILKMIGHVTVDTPLQLIQIKEELPREE